MTLFPGPEARERFRRIIVAAVLILLFFPTVCMASTPPVQPSLLFTIQNLSAGQELPLTLLVTWNRYDSFAIPLEQIIVSVFSVPDGSRLGSFPLPKTGHFCPSSDSCVYQTSIDEGDFPPGTFMLIAEDPLSGATNRQMISIPIYHQVNSEFLKKSENEQVFMLTSVTIAIFLMFVLALMVK
jgi:hypothetical protein